MGSQSNTTPKSAIILHLLSTKTNKLPNKHWGLYIIHVVFIYVLYNTGISDRFKQLHVFTTPTFMFGPKALTGSAPVVW